jgi:hypothetical protein
LRRVCAKVLTGRTVKVRSSFFPTTSKYTLFGVYRTFESERSGNLVDGVTILPWMSRLELTVFAPTLHRRRLGSGQSDVPPPGDGKP